MLLKFRWPTLLDTASRHPTVQRIRCFVKSEIGVIRHCIVGIHHCFDSSFEAFAVCARVRELSPNPGAPTPLSTGPFTTEVALCGSTLECAAH